MDSGGGSDDILAREVAETGWGRHEELSPVHLGLNRSTWRVGESLWLTGIDEHRGPILERENALLQEVRSARADSNMRIAVPQVVPTIDGDNVVQHGGRAFRATAHIKGARPDNNRAETYRGSMLVLRGLHRLLRELPSDLAVLQSGLLEVRQMVTRCLSGQWDPVTNDADERVLVNRAAEWLAPRLDGLDDASPQLIHGDWSTPNLLVDAPAGGDVIAVLDWQLCSVGPVIADIAQAVSGVLMWSELPIEPVVDLIFASYGDDVDRRLLGPAMAAYWFRNYWWAREELGRDERHRAAMDRQPQRLLSVMEYVEQLGDG